jgi:glycogen(starch) synthase
MKILFGSHFFHPSIGGIEEVSSILAHEFTAAGHVVRVVTGTREDDSTTFPFTVHRRPSPWELLRLVRWCDVFFQNNVSLQTAWPLLVVRRPWVIAHHMWLTRVDGSIGWRDRLKRRLIRCARSIAVSRPIAASLGIPATAIGNPYRAEVFREDISAPRDRELICVGRLVSQKGVDLLLDALAQLSTRPRLTIVGAGPEEGALREQCATLGLQAQVEFAGARRSAELAALLNRHRCIVVPSRCEETFGLAAVEGIACGCVAIGSDGGGLPEAIGPCGVTFERGNVADLARQLAAMLAPGADTSVFRAAAPAHLARHEPQRVAAAYLHELEEAMRR